MGQHVLLGAWLPERMGAACPWPHCRSRTPSTAVRRLPAAPWQGRDSLPEDTERLCPRHQSQHRPVPHNKWAFRAKANLTHLSRNQPVYTLTGEVSWGHVTAL